MLSVRVDAADPLSAADAADFLRLAESLPPGSLASLADALPAPPDWDPASTRTVADLAAREADRLRTGLHGRELADRLAASPGAVRLLDGLGWSAGRFASVGASFGLARVAGDLEVRRRWERVRAEAVADAAALAADGRVFASLTEVHRAAVLRRAACLPRRVLLDAIAAVPAENRDLAAGHADRLAAVLPAGFDRSAPDRLLTDRERAGVPFAEPDPTRDDAALWWDGATIVARPR